MTPLQTLLEPLIKAPAPQSVWQMRAELLQSGIVLPPGLEVLLDQFYAFLTELSARASSREYSHFASLLDMGAVGIVALQQIRQAEDRRELWQRLLFGALSEGLMVLAARQYVKAWEGEIQAVYAVAAWRLYGALWQVSLAQQPELEPDRRHALIDTLLAPVHDDEVAGATKALLLGRLFQVLLLLQLSAEGLVQEA